MYSGSHLTIMSIWFYFHWLSLHIILLYSHSGRVLNFKINKEGNQFYVAPKKRFNSMIELVEYYKTTSIKSKKYKERNLFLLYPVLVDKDMETILKKKMKQKGIQQ